MSSPPILPLSRELLSADVDERSKVGEIQFAALKTDPEHTNLAELGSLMTTLGKLWVRSRTLRQCGRYATTRKCAVAGHDVTS
jgi:hypothetical protein